MTSTGVDVGRHVHVLLLDMPTMSHINYGLWAHPDNQKVRFHTAEFWREIAVEAEKALLDGIFLADVVGIDDSFGGSMDMPIREGMQVPSLDPLLVAATAMTATKHLGFAMTSSTSYDHPYGFARRMATLDHLSGGRVGWNIVMTLRRNSDENHGVAFDPRSAPRYEKAEEYLEICYRLWEQSWEPDAVVADRAAGVYADPAKVHRIDYVGEHWSSTGPSVVDSSPQRTPVLFQAGMSDRGRSFSAKHAEAVFMFAKTMAGLKESVIDLRRRVAAAGRARNEVLALPQAQVVVGATAAEAQAKLADFQSRSRVEVYAAHEFTLSPFDPLKHPREKLLDEALVEDGLSADDLVSYGYGPGMTIGEVLERAGDLSREKMLAVGDPVSVADTIEGWMDDYDVDGFLLRNYMHPGTLQDFGRLVVPELQRRGRYRTEYEGTTLREHLFGAGHRHLPPSHVGSRAERDLRPAS